jgi:hypothetical protein
VCAEDTIGFRCQVDAVALTKGKTIDGVMSAFGTISLADSYHRLVEQLSPDSIWTQATGPSSIHLGISLEALSILKVTNPEATLSSIPYFAVGTNFWNSLIANKSGPGGVFSDVVRETCARIVIGKPKYPIGKFLKRPASKRGKWGQAVRDDGARGFRTHVAKHHEALRLMFWEITKTVGSDQRTYLEFSNIGPKYELAIVSGALEGRTDRSW